MDRTPDEIKKGLECCSAHGRGRSTDCKSCPFRWKTPGCEFRMHRHALALIQQLQKDKADLLEERELNDYLRDKVKQLKAERDALQKGLETVESPCDFCRYLNKEGSEYPCNRCKHISNGKKSHFDWRGVQKEDGNAKSP